MAHPGLPPTRLCLRISDTAKLSPKVRDIARMKTVLRLRPMLLTYRRLIAHADGDTLRDYAEFMPLPRPTFLEAYELRPRCVFEEQSRVLQHMRDAHKNSAYLAEVYPYLPFCGSLELLLPLAAVPELHWGAVGHAQGTSSIPRSIEPQQPVVSVTEVDDDEPSVEQVEDLAPLMRVASHSEGNLDTAPSFATEGENQARLDQLVDQAQGSLTGQAFTSAEIPRSRGPGLAASPPVPRAGPGPSPLQNMYTPWSYDSAEGESQDIMLLDMEEPGDEPDQTNWIAAIPEEDDSSEWETDSEDKNGIYVDPELHPLTIAAVDDKFELLKGSLKSLDGRQEDWDLHRLLTEYHHEEPYDVDFPELVTQVDVLLTLRAWIEHYQEFRDYLDESFRDMRIATARRSGRNNMARFGSDMAHVILSRGEGSPLFQSISADEVDSLIEEESWGGARSRPPRRRLLGSVGTPVSRPAPP